MPDAPTADEIAKWHRWFAVECNNQAWGTAELPERTEAQADALLDAAHAARLHWGVGDALNAARADLLLGQAHALAGCGDLALRYARRSFEYLTSVASPDWEVAFAHAVLAHAAFAAGDGALHATHYREAERLGEAIADAGDKEIFLATFGSIPRP